MEAEPHHHFAFENQLFRIFEPSIDPGDATLDHEHALDYASVCVSGASTRSRNPGADWGAAGTPCVEGSAAISEHVGRPMVHRAQNVSTTPFRLLLVESRRASNWSDFMALSAPFTRVLRDSRAFRLYRVTLGARTEESRHLHRQPTVVVLTSGDLAVRSADEKHLLDRPGRWAVTVAGVEHTLSPGLAGHSEAIEIEVR